MTAGMDRSAGYANLVSVLDVAQHVVDRLRKVSVVRLHALCYFSMAYSLLWDEDRMFADPCLATRGGPKFAALRDALPGVFLAPESIPGADAARLSARRKENIGIVLDSYAGLSMQALIGETLKDGAWRKAWAGGRWDGLAEMADADVVEHYAALT